MADQHLDLRSVTPEALHFADGIEDVLVDVVVFNDSSGLGDRFVTPSLLCIGTILQVKLLELLSIYRDTELGFGKLNHAPII